MRPFGCPVTILNTLDPLGKFDGKADEGFLVGYSISSKAFRVFNSRIRIIQKTLHINFLENQPNMAGNRPTWLFDIDTLTQSMNYQPVVAGNQPNSSAGIKENFVAGKVVKEAMDGDVDAAFNDKENESKVHVSPSSSDKTKKHNEKAKREAKRKRLVDFAPVTAVRQNSTNSSNSFNVVGPYDNVVSQTFEIGGKYSFVDPFSYPDDPDMPALEDIVYSNDVGAEADFSNFETSIPVCPIPITKVHKDHPVTQIIGNLSSAPQTRKPKRVHQALKDPSWIEAMQEELLQFKMKKEEGMDYEEVFASVARIEVIWLFLAYASFMGFMNTLGFMRPFGCPVTILNTLDPLGKFDGKADE
nr:retrovirus-related Pol polyprotein from transposon TNT 1-94 [Tanacetum cinerariifolium]